MARASRLSGGANAALIIALAIVIAVAVNILSGQLYGRLDLTADQVNVLSDASAEVVDSMDGLVVDVYISEDMPPTLPVGRDELDVQALPQRFRDKLEEYRSVAGDGMTINYVRDNVVEQAEQARLIPITGKGGEVTARGFQADKYVIGATFNYKGAREVYELALQDPDRDTYEFEITKRLVRLREKAEHSVKMKSVLRAGAGINDAVKTCVAALEAAQPADDPAQGGMQILTSKALEDKVSAFRAEEPAVKAACAPVSDAVAAARAEEGKHDQLDRVILIADHFAKTYQQVLDAIGPADAPADGGQAATQAAQVLSQLPQVVAVGKAIDAEYADLLDAPGKRRIGVVCAAGALCPFPDGQPLIPEMMAGAILKDKQFMQQMVGQAEQILQQVAQLQAQIEQALFRSQGHTVVKVDLAGDIPDDVRALLVFAPTGDFSDYELYRLDQFVMHGGSLVVFLDQWDVQLQHYNSQMQLKEGALVKTATNLGELLKHWGIVPTTALVAEPKNHAQLSTMAFLQQGEQLIPFQRVPREYPFLPRFSTFDEEDPLVRSLSSVTLPYATALNVKPDAVAASGGHVKALILSSSEAVTVDDSGFPAEPDAVMKRVLDAAASGPVAVAAVATGPLPSAFGGKDAPAKPEAPADPSKPEASDDADPLAEVTPEQRLDQGDGRVLVIGSNLGLEPIGREAIFAGFDMTMLAQQDFVEPLKKFRQYFANWRNWQGSLQQTQHLLGESLPLLSNALDWAIQQDALAELRAKVFIQRPLEGVEEGDEGTYQAAGILVPPIVFFLCALAWLAWRRARRRRLTL